MKIWIPSIRTGSGSDVYVERLAHSLRAAGVTVEVQWFGHYFEFCPYLLRVVRPPQDTDIIFANSWSAVGFTHHGIPVVTCIHHCVHDPAYRQFKSWLQSLYHRWLIYPFEAAGIAGSTFLVSGSDFTRHQVSEVFKVAPPELISYAIETDLFLAPTCQKTHQPYKLLFIGNQSKRKGFDLLAPIMQQLGSDFKLYFTSGLRNYDIGRDIPHAECVGSLSTEQLVALYQSCDMLLFPTRYEGFGYAVAEAMACGLPVVASACSSIPELLDEGKGGFLCPVNEVSYFVEKVRLLQSDESLAQAMGAHNRASAVTKFGFGRMAQEYIDLFTRILSERR